MTEQEARAWNAAIEAAAGKYKQGIGAILAMKVKYAVTVEHIGTTTKQEVVDIDEENGRSDD